MLILSLLLAATFLLSIYDFQYRTVPNWATFPIMVAGIILHFPGVPEVWLGSLILVLFGCLGGGRIGFGDVKLWLASFWLLPRDMAGVGTLIGFGVIFITSLTQLAYFRMRKLSPSRPHPAVWRVFISILILLMEAFTGIYHA